MAWLPLDSEMLASAAYDADRQILHLRFHKTGDVYRYFDVPATEYQAFPDGHFFLTHIRGSYLTSAWPGFMPPELSIW